MAKGAAVGFQLLREQSQQGMAGFVEDEVGMVQDQDKAGLTMEHSKDKGAEPNCESSELARGHRLPVVSHAIQLSINLANRGQNRKAAAKMR